MATSPTGLESPASRTIQTAAPIPDFSKDPYQNNAVLRLRKDGCSPVEVRVVAQLGNSTACVLRVIDTSTTSPESEQYSVLKVFDPRFTAGVWTGYGLLAFDHARLLEMEHFLRSGAFEDFRRKLYLPMSTFEAWVADYDEDGQYETPTVFGRILEDAIGDESTLKEMEELGILTKPTDIQLEAFLWEKTRQNFCHECSIFTLTEQNPSISCPKARAFLHTHPDVAPNHARLFEFGAILMEHFPGVSLQEVIDAAVGDDESTLAPYVRSLVPRSEATGLQRFRSMNEAMYSLSRVGLQSTDYSTENISSMPH